MVSLKSLAKRYRIRAANAPCQYRLLADLVRGGVVPAFKADMSRYDTFLRDVCDDKMNDRFRDYIERVYKEEMSITRSEDTQQKLLARGVGHYAGGALKTVYAIYKDGIAEELKDYFYVAAPSDNPHAGTDFPYKIGETVLIVSVPDEDDGGGLHSTILDKLWSLGYRTGEVVSADEYDNPARMNDNVGEWMYSLRVKVSPEHRGDLDAMSTFAPLIDDDGNVEVTLYESNLRPEVDTTFIHTIGDVLRVVPASDDPLGVKARRSIRDYRGRWGEVVNRSVSSAWESSKATSWPVGESGGKSIDKELVERGMKPVGYSIYFLDENCQCGKPLGALAVCPGCGEKRAPPVWFYEHEVVPVGTEEQWQANKVRRGYRPMPDLFVTMTDEQRNDVDALVINPPELEPVVDVDLTGESTVSFYRKGEKDWDLVGHYTKKYEGKGSALVKELIKEHNNRPFRFSYSGTGASTYDTTNDVVSGVSVALVNGEYEYTIDTLDNPAPVSKSKNRPLTIPKWTNTGGALVYMMLSDGRGNGYQQIPFDGVDRDNLPFVVSDKFYEYTDGMGKKWRYRTKWLRVCGYVGDLGRKNGCSGGTGAGLGDLFTDDRTAYYVNAEIEYGEADGKTKTTQILFNPYSMLRYCTFDDWAAHGYIYVPVDAVLLEGATTLARLPPEPDVMFKIYAEDGEAISIIERVRDSDYVPVGPGLGRRFMLPSGERFTNRIRILRWNAARAPRGQNTVCKVTRIDQPDAEKPPVFHVDKVSGDSEENYILAKDFLGDGVQIGSFEIHEKDNRPKKYFSDDFVRAVVGEAFPAGEQTTKLPAGDLLDGMFKDTFVFAKKMLVTGVAVESGASKSYVVETTPPPAKDGQFDEIVVFYDENKQIFQALLGRGGVLETGIVVSDTVESHVAKGDPPIYVRSIDVKEYETFASRQGITLDVPEQNEADATFKTIEKKKDDCVSPTGRDIHELSRANAQMIVGSIEKNASLDSWLGGRHIGGPAGPVKHSEYGGSKQPFSATVVFEDDTSFNYLQGQWSVHYPIQAREIYFTLLHPDKELSPPAYVQNNNIVNLWSVCVKGYTYITGGEVGHEFHIGQMVGGKKVKLLLLEIPGITKKVATKGIAKVPASVVPSALKKKKKSKKTSGSGKNLPWKRGESVTIKGQPYEVVDVEQDQIGTKWTIVKKQGRKGGYEVRHNVNPDPSKAWSREEFSCNCPGWTRQGEPRSCKHTEALKAALGK